MFLDLLDPHLDLLVTSMESDAVPAPDPSLFLESVGRTEIMVAKNWYKNFLAIIYFNHRTYIYSRRNTINTEDFCTDPHPDPYQYVTNPEHGSAGGLHDFFMN